MRTVTQWQVVADSARGASHLRSGQPNQDAFLWYPADGQNLPLAVAVSDGHGSQKCFRSDEGALFAVTQATRLIHQFAVEVGESSIGDIRAAAVELPKRLVEAWQTAVEEALTNNPIRAEQLEILEAQAGASARAEVEQNPLLAYGATLIAVLVTHSSVLYLQLGDGDILTVSETGTVSRPLPKDRQLFANETTSLCLPDASRAMRFELRQLVKPSPALIMLATDGYSNSFERDEDFEATGSDLLNIVRSEGLDVVKKHLNNWLDETSKAGSGDDVTAALICRLENNRDALPVGD